VSKNLLTSAPAANRLAPSQYCAAFPREAIEPWSTKASLSASREPPHAGAKPELQARWRISGSYVIIEDLRVTTPVSGPSWGISIGSAADHIAVRHSDFAGNNIDNGPGAVLAVEGATDAVIYKNVIHDNGSHASIVENDMHGVSVGAGSARTWVVDNEIHHNGGDGIHLTGTTHAYIARNAIHHDRENGVEVSGQAFVENVVISQNTIHGYRESSSSGGEAINVSGGGAATSVWALSNGVHDATIGIRVSGTNRAWVIGNVVREIEGKAIALQASAPVNVYHNIAHTRSVIEVSEGNNCRAATAPVQVTAPDLVVSMVGEPPPVGTVSGSFTVSSTVQNSGNGVAGTSSTRFYLSLDTVYNSGDKRLTGSLSEAVLASGAQSAGVRTVDVPSSTLPGVYFLLACADDTKVVAESSETNNCIASAGKITISQ
jgi:hypothetical protein